MGAAAIPRPVQLAVLRPPEPESVRVPSGDFIARGFAFACFALLVVLNVILPGVKVAGLPVRGILAGGLLVLGAILFTERTALAVKTNLHVLLLAAGLALLGVLVSIVNGSSLTDIVTALVEVHLQTAILVVVAATLGYVCGARACLVAILAVTAITSFVAVLQLAGVESAWSWRGALGGLQDQSLETLRPWVNRRPMGLSYAPIQLATQFSLAFAAYAAVRDIERRKRLGRTAADPQVIVAIAALVAISVASGTRSTILGAGLFLAAYTAFRPRSWLPFFAAVAVAGLYFAWPHLVSLFGAAQPRLVRVDDDSATGRLTLAYYGLRLFLSNPLGYGLAFRPWEHWTAYWPDLYTMPGPQGVKVHELHNYVLSMLNMYGIGIALFAPILVKLLRRAAGSLIFFVPYIVHILFHNAGPFYNETVIWFVTAAISAAALAAPEPPKAAPRAQPGTAIVQSRDGRLFLLRSRRAFR